MTLGAEVHQMETSGEQVLPLVDIGTHDEVD